MGIVNSYGSMLSDSVRSLRLSALRCSAGRGGFCFCSGTCGWLTRLLLSVRWSGRLRFWPLSGQWSRVGNACGLWFIRLLGRGLLCSRPFPKLPLPSWSALHDFAQRDRPAPTKGWDEVDPDHLFLSVRIQVPLRPCLAIALPLQPSAGCPFGCIVRKAVLSTHSRTFWYAMSGLTLPLRFALPCSFLYTWRVWWRGYPAFHVATCVTSSSRSITSYGASQGVAEMSPVTIPKPSTPT
jgi:hypothetical protein